MRTMHVRGVCQSDSTSWRKPAGNYQGCSRADRSDLSATNHIFFPKQQMPCEVLDDFTRFGPARPVSLERPPVVPSSFCSTQTGSPEWQPRCVPWYPRWGSSWDLRWASWLVLRVPFWSGATLATVMRQGHFVWCHALFAPQNVRLLLQAKNLQFCFGGARA